MNLVLSVLGVTFLMVMMDNTILNVALEDIQAELNASTAELQWAVDSYILVYAALMFTAGLVADRLGRKKILIAGLLIFAVASAMAGLSSSPTELILWRGVMGIGGAVIPPATLAIIRSSLPKDRQAAAMGVWSALGGLSVAFGPILGGAILEKFSWGNVFFINIPIAVICCILLGLFSPESRSSSVQKLDPIGIVLSIICIGTFVFGIIQGGESGNWLSLSSGGFMFIGAILAVVLVVVELRMPFPAFDVQLLSSKAFAGGTLAISAAFFSLTGGTFLLVFYVQQVLGKTPLQLGFVLLPVAIGSVLGAIGSNAIVHKFGYKITVFYGLLALVVAILGLLIVDPSRGLLLLEVSLLIAGLGMGLTMASTTSLVMATVPPDRAGVSSAVNNTLRQVGAALGVAILGSLLTQNFRSAVSEEIKAFPVEMRDVASSSLGAALNVAKHAGGSPELLEAFRNDYVDSMHATLWIALIVLLGAMIVGLKVIPRDVAAAPVE